MAEQNEIKIEPFKTPRGKECFVVRLENGKLLDSGAPFESEEAAQKRIDYIKLFRKSDG